MNEPTTAYAGDDRAVWDDMNGWNVHVTPGVDGHVEVVIGASGLEADSWYTSGNSPDTRSHTTLDDGLARFLGEPR